MNQEILEYTVLLNPEFATPNFIPDPEKEYHNSTRSKSSGWTYLMALVMSGNYRVEELKEYSKTDTFRNECKKVNNLILTPLMLASINSNKDSSEKTVEMLIPYSDCNFQDIKGWTALMFSSRLSNIDSSERTVEMLIPYSDCNIKNKYGWTALIMASRNSNTDSSEKTVEMLIPHSDCNIQDTEGWTALMYACEESNNDSSERTVVMLIPHTDIDFNSPIIKQNLELISRLQNKINKELMARLKEQKIFKECLKEGLNLHESIITSYL